MACIYLHTLDGFDVSCQVWVIFDVTDKLKGNVSFQKHLSTKTKRLMIMRKQDVIIDGVLLNPRCLLCAYRAGKWILWDTSHNKVCCLFWVMISEERHRCWVFSHFVCRLVPLYWSRQAHCKNSKSYRGYLSNFQSKRLISSQNKTSFSNAKWWFLCHCT